MDKLKYVRLDKISLREYPEFDERWIWERVNEDPEILGLGPVIIEDPDPLV